MAAEMPERIWAYIWDPGEIEVNGVWDTTKRDDATEYVLASTHQRVIEALREAEKALEPFAGYAAFIDANNWDEDCEVEVVNGKSVLLTTTVSVLRRVRAALAAIKEHTP